MSDGIFITEQEPLEGHRPPVNMAVGASRVCVIVSERASVAAGHSLRSRGAAGPGTVLAGPTFLMSLGPHRTSHLGGLRQHRAARLPQRAPSICGASQVGLLDLLNQNGSGNGGI